MSGQGTHGPRVSWTDRSRIETAQRCRRARWHEYHDGPRGLGIVAARKPLPLAVGGSVHAGLAVLLDQGSRLGEAASIPQAWRALEDRAVAAALADFAQFAGRLDAQGEPVPQVADDAFQRYLYAEQAALVEAMVRAYARHRLRALLEQFEVLEVEREGTWPLSAWSQDEGKIQVCCQTCGYKGAPLDPADGYSYSVIACPKCNHTAEYYSARMDRELRFMSRPDALLLDCQSRELYILSFKTTASWGDVRKLRDAEHDMQGLSEGIEVEQRLRALWHAIHDEPKPATLHEALSRGLTHRPEGFGRVDKNTVEYLRLLHSPPRIHAIRYEYLVKGERWRDRDLSERLGGDVRVQRSPLVRAYLNAGLTAGDEQWCWSWEYLKEGTTVAGSPLTSGEESKLYYKTWRATPVWEHMPVARWIDMLDSAAMVVSAETGEHLGYASDAQATGRTRAHPFDGVFPPPVVVYRQDDELRDLVEQIEAQECGIVEAAARVHAAQDEGERRHLLNVLFPQSRRACFYPTECAYTMICYGGEDIRHDPLGSGRYKIREPNHAPERSVETGTQRA